MTKIRLLPDDVVSQIAAGEVVERPASVVKELVENALDAGATQIKIRVSKGGRQLIEISDNGSGIPFNEVELAVTRHATSKLASAADLFAITTLGFRGEALASIASVSRFTITTQAKNADLGARLTVDGGRVGKIEQIGAPHGTVVRMENLFYNVPARLKFLKKDVTERGRIDALVMRYAMAYPHVRFTLEHEQRTAIQTSGNGDRREVLANLYGTDLAKEMLEIGLNEPGMVLSGFISPIAQTRATRRDITFFVNGRWIQDQTLSRGINQAYHNLIPVGRYPIAVIFIEIDPDLVDVNVHPAKAEVRFRETNQVYDLVHRAVRRALKAFSPAPTPTQTMHWQPQWSRPTTPQPELDPAWDKISHTPGTVTTTSSIINPGQNPQPELPVSDLPILNLIGQAGGAYLIAEGPDGLYLIDQNAAHERVLYEKLLSGQPQTIAAQSLLSPVVLDVNPEDSEILIDQLSVIGELGYDLEVFGPNAFRIRAIPSILGDTNPQDAVTLLLEDSSFGNNTLLVDKNQKLALQIARRAAVKRGQILSREEQLKLLGDLEQSVSPRTSPTGRPTMIHISAGLLERQFGRNR
jgi:DNA mismatch repair protein MutL